MSSASVKINQAASPEPPDNVKGDSTETTITIQPVGLHVKNLVIGLTGNYSAAAYRRIGRSMLLYRQVFVSVGFLQ